MRLDEIKQVVQNKLASLHTARSHAFLNGDFATMERLDIEIAETQETLAKVM